MELHIFCTFDNESIVIIIISIDNYLLELILEHKRMKLKFKYFIINMILNVGHLVQAIIYFMIHTCNCIFLEQQ